MEDMYVTAGNQERGWNDPPQFSYGLQTARPPPRNLLNKRAAPPAGPGAPPPLYSSANPLAPTQCGLAPPPLYKAGPPPGCLAPPLPPSGPMMSQKEAGRSQSESVPDVEAVVLVLKRALAACRQTIGDQVCNDVDKRLRLLEDGWRSGQLSVPVKRRMDALSQELQSGHWDAADEIHRSLMVDHVTEVIPWMVGVKRLIAETRNLSPELLQLLHHPAEPVQEPVSQS
ncbi:steroid receptor RNA activator 1 isoform X1 [Platichthys flesus]|uniref:steroid receptor RNA activator 1 isoform X1 n=1 Tax=Platichthys flesus TaxID=8260 RepID=UPI002DBDD764|nr:steroid receptor RNA activator 1 isoform X1 [Platichthys flesus]